MIKPHKFMDVKMSVLNLASYIVTELKVNRITKYDDLLIKVSSNFEDDIKDLLILSLSFLFSIGVIDYNKEHDQVELLI